MKWICKRISLYRRVRVLVQVSSYQVCTWVSVPLVATITPKPGDDTMALTLLDQHGGPWHLVGEADALLNHVVLMLFQKKMDPRVKQTSRFFFRPKNLKRSIPPGQLECSMIHTVILRCIPIPPINQTPSTSLQDTELCAACIAPFRPSTKEASSNKLEDLDRWGDEKFPVQSVWFQVVLVDFLVE